MAQGLLRIYVEDKDGNIVSFPPNEEQAIVEDWTRTAERMAGAPSVTGTVMHRLCLDNLWTKKEFVVIGSERYYVKQVPTSSKDNEDVRYKHDVTLVSERDILENVYFFDVVTKREDAQASDKPRSNTTDFSFYGDLKELVERLNDSLSYSKIYDAEGVNGFCIVIDDGVEIGEAQEVSITDAYFATAMQEIYNVFGVPYYWVGKICHVGYAQNEIEKPFEYGKDNGLLSVSKNNSEYRLINRITGMGSADNIPYYYPNTDPNGEPILAIKNMDRANIKSIQLTTINAKFGGSVGKTFCLGNIKEENATTELFNDDKTLNGIAKYAAPYLNDDSGTEGYIDEDPVDYQEEQLPMILEFEFYAYVNDEIDASSLSINTTYKISGATTTIDFNKGSQPNWGQTCSPPIEGWDAEAKIIMPDGYEEIITANDTTYRCKKQGIHKLIINCTPSYRVSMHPASKPGQLEWATIDWYCHIKGAIKFKTFYGDVIYQSGRVFKIEESGISIIGDNLPKLDLVLQPSQDYGSFDAHIIGGSIATCAQFTITGIDFINPISKLMPYVYREQKGAERFYNALNEKYKDEEGNFYSFNNPYLPNEPLEGKQDFEDIKPTINGITNAQGQLFGEVADIAFDETDSDDLAIKDGDSNTANLVHSYFYIKLHKFDGDYGFNLFKQGLSKGAMTLNFITGSCAGCAFEVHVADEKKQVDNHYEFTNPVQVDENGNIVAGDFDDKIKNNPIASQQDTINNEVWVALLKDQSTFGVVMPNATNNYKPNKGDKFVITNILLPTQYITAAEKRLEAALIKYMSENNDEKFTFSIKFSRIYLQKHIEDIVPYLNENARINVKYNNTTYPLYVSSYTQKYDDNILDEISVELSEELTITQNKSKQQMDSIMGNVNSGISESITISSTELLNQIQLLLDKKLSKTDNDSASGIITFLKGFNFANTLLTSLVKSTDWRKIMDDSQLVTGGGMARYVENILANLADKYLRRDIDDEANGLITFLKGLKSDDIATFMSGMEVAGLAMFKNTVSSETFVSGWDGYGWRLIMKEAMNVVGSLTKRSELEVHDLVVRGSLKAFEFVINQLRGENDNFVFAGMQKVDHVDETNKAIYLDSNNGETYCPFTAGDILRCQRFQTGGTIIKQYDILVKEAHVGSLSDGENRIDSIVWEAFSGDINDIAQGDVLCRLDNDRDPERKGIITTTSVGSNSPYIDVIYGLITNPKESLKVRLGKLDGIVNELLGELSGYGLYSNNAFLTGEFYLSTGEAVSTKIKMLENLFSSSMSKTTYDIKEDDNIVQNCAFVEDMRGWTTVDGDDMDLFFIDDDTPVFMDDDMFSDGHSVAAMENMQGKEMLHLLNAGITQANSLFVGRVPEDSEVEEYVKDADGNIVKNEDGTLKTETKTIRPTIYISYRYMCKESGSLSIGFNNGRTTQYSSDMGTIISVDELGTLTENVNANEGVWIERQYKGYYDKLGDFVISTTGEVYIDVLAVTSKPLNDFKNVVSTALVQTAGAIGLYGRNIKAAYDNIGGLNTSITELGVQVNAEAEKVDIFVNKTYPAKMTEIDNRLTVNEKGISATAKTVEGNTTRIGQLEVSSDRIGMYVTKTRTAGAELVYNNTVTIRTDEDNKTATALDYVINPTFLIANEEQTITNIQIAGGSGSGNPHLEVVTEPFGVKVVCANDVVFTEPVLLEAVVTVTRDEENVYGETEAHTYQRSMFITVYPSTKGETGYRGAFKSTVFKRSLTKPDKPTGGSYDNPVPSGWSDGIPALADGEANYRIWASSKVMYDYPSSSDWSDPAAMTDTADFDVEFSSVASPSAPTGHPNTNTQWSNNADENTIWMATSVCKNGVWTDWEVIKAKGEKGDPGRGVTSVNTFYALHTSLSATPSDGAFTYDALSDVVISSNADMYVWSADKVTYSEGDPEFTGKYCIGKCSDLTSVSEQYGTSSSATNEPTTWSDTYPQDIPSGSYIWTRDKITWKDGSVTYSSAQLSGQIPVGISSIVNTYNVTATSTTAPTEWKTNSPAVTDENPFLWRKMVITYTNGTTKTDISLIGAKGSKGVDGTSIEYIYKLSTTESVPATPSTSQDDDYVPTGWSDDPQGVTSTNKFEYVSSRTKSNGAWSAFSTPSLWAKYSEDGKQGATGYGFVATVDRNNKFTETQWNETYGATGHTETWSNTSAIRNGCRVGDIFLVTGYASDTLNMHSAFYRSTTTSGNLTGTCISHSVVARGQKGDTGAGEVWQLIDNGCYASVTAEEKLTLYLAYVVVYTIDGTSVSNTNYKVYWKANNKTDWHYASNGVMLNAVDFNKDATYEETESFVVRLESNGVAVGTITVPVKLAPGAAQIITDNMIKTNVFGSSAWSSVKQTSDDITSGVYSKTADVNKQISEINSTLALKANSASLSVYAKTTDVNGIVTSLKGMGIDIDTEEITIRGTGNFIVDTGNFKVKSDGTIECSNGIFRGEIEADSGTIGGIKILERGIMANSVDSAFILSKTGELMCSKATIKGDITATSGTFDECTINDTCKISGELVSVHGQFGAWVLGDNGGYDLTCEQTVDTMFIMTNTRHKALRNVYIRTTNGNSKYFGDSVTDNTSQLYVQTDDGTCAEFNVWYTGGTALRLIAPSGATALYVGGLSKFSGNVSMSLYTTIPTIKGYLYRDSNGFVKIKI